MAGAGLMLIARVLFFLVPASFEGTTFLMVAITSLQIVPTLAIYILQHFLVARDKIREVNVSCELRPGECLVRAPWALKATCGGI